MLLHPVLENLKKLRLCGMIEALQQPHIGNSVDLSFEERLALLVDNEIAFRENNKLQIRLRKAKLRQNACLQNLDYAAGRGLDKSLLVSMESCLWIHQHRNILITGATGTGKTFLGEALAHNACMKGYTAHHLRLPRFFEEIISAKANGSYLKWMKELANYDVLFLDDLGVAVLTEQQGRELLEVVDDRYNKKSTIISSQLPVREWHEAIGDKTLADAILDRVVHNSHRIELKGESMRKILSNNRS